MQFRLKQIAPPKEWGRFESLCHAIFKELWNDPLAQKNGRNGQPQNGVDIWGSIDGSRTSFRGVQCKGKDAYYGSKAAWAEILDEIKKAESFYPDIEHWVFATTAPVDGRLQEKARVLSLERNKQKKFTIDVLGWEELLALLASAPDVVSEFYPEHADHVPDILDALRELPSIKHELEDLLKRFVSTSVAIEPVADSSNDWEALAFGGGRGLGPALMGYPMGPSDAAACPEIPEVGTAISLLKIAFSARLVGVPGAGKSLAAYQVANRFAQRETECFRLTD